MKTRTLVSMAIAVTACLAAIPVWAQQAQQSAFYVGGAVGQAKAKDACNGLAGLPISCDDTDTAVKVFAGYQFHKNFALEVGYVDLGKATATGTIAGVPVNADVKARGWEGLGVGLLPFNEQLSAYGKAGFMRWHAKGTATALGIGGVTVENNGTDFTFGVGMRYDFTKSLGARLEWQRYKNIGNSATTGQSDVDLVSLGILFKF